MGQFIFRRTFYAIATLLILSLTIFTVVRLTGDPVTLMAEPGAQEADLDLVRAEWGLDRPLPVQYAAFVKSIITGELGQSFNYQMPVRALYFQRLPNSLELALAATLISFFIGIPAGILSAVRVNSVWDHVGKTIALLGLSVPGFWLACTAAYPIGRTASPRPTRGVSSSASPRPIAESTEGTSTRARAS